jgi:hypothetical protein
LEYFSVLRRCFNWYRKILAKTYQTNKAAHNNVIGIRPVEKNIRLVDNTIRLAVKGIRLVDNTIRLAEKDIRLAANTIRPVEKDIRLGKKGIRAAAKNIRLVDNNITVKDKDITRSVGNISIAYIALIMGVLRDVWCDRFSWDFCSRTCTRTLAGWR